MRISGAANYGVPSVRPLPCFGTFAADSLSFRGYIDTKGCITSDVVFSGGLTTSAIV
jgi:hypothetical protein